MKPKLGAAKGLISRSTGLDINSVIPLEDKHYLAVAIALELLGGLLFIVNSELGAVLLVRRAGKNGTKDDLAILGDGAGWVSCSPTA